MKEIGARFGMLTITKICKSTKEVECLCDCGKKITIPYSNLTNKIVNSCGCSTYETAREKGRKEKHKSHRTSLQGQIFSQLKVLEEVEIPDKKYKRFWKCICSCGNEVVVEQGNLKQGLTTSCGCARKKKHTIHNFSNTRIYRIWNGMKSRCYNPNTPDYQYYGLKGISVCEEWLNDFLTFHEWSLKNGYSENLTIDRINPFRNYEPSNCRWVDRKEQAKNTRKNYKSA